MTFALHYGIFFWCNTIMKTIDKEAKDNMKSTGIVRKLDELGRITLPIELRRNLNVNERDPLEIFVDDDKIILTKYNPSDVFTGSMDELVEYCGKKVSKESIKELAKLAGLTIVE